MTPGELGFRPWPIRVEHAPRPSVRFFLVQSPGMHPDFGPPLGSFPLGLIHHLQAQPFRERTSVTDRVTTVSPEGGWRQIVCWGEFKQLLQSQIAHPERLRDSHRLVCSVNVHEAPTWLAHRDVEAELAREDGAAVRLEPLTRELVMRLGLGALLPGQRHPRHPARRSFVELHVEEDPTRQAQPRALPAAAGPGPAAAPGGGVLHGRAIPSQWVRPWEFRVSRDEALYDFEAAHTKWGRLSSACRRVFGAVPTRRAMGKWKVLLTGKPIDQQLWGVRPPRQALTHPQARRWVEQALAAAGYDAVAMLKEWEIFWRRKGV